AAGPGAVITGLASQINVISTTTLDTLTVSGGGGNDTLNTLGGVSALTGLAVDGGPGSDNLIVPGTSGNDTIDINQTTSTSLTLSINGGSTTESLTPGSIENIIVQTGDGDDVVHITQGDNISGSIGITLDGGVGADRLIVSDAGTGDLVLYRKSPTPNAGTVIVGTLAAI